MSNWKIKSSLEEWENINDSIEQELRSSKFTDRFINSILLAMDEVIANISGYAYGQASGDVVVNSRIDIDETERKVTITFVDYGEKFNPLEFDTMPDVFENTAEKRKPGGLGIFLIKKQVDELRYEYIDGSNNLTLIKKEEV